MRQLLRRRPAGSIDSEPDGESGRSSHGRPRPWLVAGILALLVLGVCAGWFLVTLFQSPEQRAADAEPPERGPLFSAVTVGALAETLTLQGEIEPGSVHQLFLPVSGVDKLTVVTAHPVDGGARIESGEQITEANGRPVFLIESPFDLYRDLGIGDSGPDVENLQETLVKRGLLNQADGRFGAATASAVAVWYRKNGYEPPTRDKSQSSPSTEAPGSDDRSSSDAGQRATPEKPPPSEIYVPLSEVVAVPLTSMITLNSLPVGSHVGAPGVADVRLGSSDVRIRVSSGSRAPAGLSKGERVNFSGEGFSGTGEFIEAVTTKASKDEQGSSDEVKLVFDPAEGADASKIGDLVTLSVTVKVVSEDALIVPTVALVEDANGAFRVLKRQQDGSTLEVPVRVLGSLNGASAVEPEPGVLSVDDQVRVS